MPDLTRIDPTTHMLALPDATLAYDVRRGDRAAVPPLLMIGYPIGAAGFGTLAGHFFDRAGVRGQAP